MTNILILTSAKVLGELLSQELTQRGLSVQRADITTSDLTVESFDLGIVVVGDHGDLDSLVTFRKAHPEMRCVCLLLRSNVQLATTVLSFNCGILREQGTLETLFLDVEKAIRGEFVIDPDLLVPLFQRNPFFRRLTNKRSPDEPSEREKEILVLLGSGWTNKAIAESLSISDHTVRAHLRTIFSKLGVKNRAEAATWAIRNNLTT